MYASSSMPASAYFLRSFERDEEAPSPAISLRSHKPKPAVIIPQPPATPVHARRRDVSAEHMFRGHRCASLSQWNAASRGRTSAVRQSNGRPQAAVSRSANPRRSAAHEVARPSSARSRQRATASGAESPRVPAAPGPAQDPFSAAAPSSPRTQSGPRPATAHAGTEQRMASPTVTTLRRTSPMERGQRTAPHTPPARTAHTVRQIDRAPAWAKRTATARA